MEMSERQASSMKGPVLLEILLPWLKWLKWFFCLPGARNKHSWILSVLSFSLQSTNTPQRLLCSFPQSHFSFRHPSCLGFCFLLPFGSLLSCMGFQVCLFSGFSHFSIFELFLSAAQPLCVAPFSFHSLSIVYLVLFVIFASIYFPPPSSYFFISGPLLPLLDSPVPIPMPFDQTSSPHPYLKQLKKHSQLEWSNENRLQRIERWQSEPGKGVLAALTTSPSSAGRLLCLRVPCKGKTQHKGREKEEMKVRAQGTGTAKLFFKYYPLSVCLGNSTEQGCISSTEQLKSASLKLGSRCSWNKTAGQYSQNVSTWP